MLPKVPRLGWLIVAACALAAAPALAQTPVGTAFTYQGRLTDNGSPATGAYDLQLVLFDAAVGGAQVGPILTRDDVAVTNGLFTVSLDFGGVFAGSKHWLEIRVRPGASTGAYSTLSPRQELSPTPNAVFSATVPWAGIASKPAGFADDIDNDSGGTITGVTAGTGLTGGGTSAAVSLAVDPSLVQSRVSSSCAAGSSIRAVNQDGTVTCQADTTGSDWRVTGNAGTNPATNFIGTTDSVPFDLRVNNRRALRLEPVTSVIGLNTYVGANVVGGAASNSITSGVPVATIAGGGGTVNGGPLPNRVTDLGGTVGGGALNLAGNDAGTLSDAYYATVAGGWDNAAGGNYSAVGGGQGNRAGGPVSAVGGGFNNTASGDTSVIAGGYGSTAGGLSSAVAGGQGNTASGDASAVGGGGSNTAGGFAATVAGGWSNTASGTLSTVAGGQGNTAGGDHSLAAGRQARVRDATTAGDSNGDEGTFVWADSTLVDFVSTGPNQFLIRAGGGVGVNTNAPLAGLHVLGLSTNEGTAFFLPDASKGTFASHVHYGPNGDWYIRSANANGSVILQDAGGNVGIGTATPSAKLHVVGDAVVTGTLSKGAGSFKIDHPLDPENKYLYHSFVESPDMKNIYDGVVVTDGEGYATVELPEWFEALNRDFRYQLTVIGQFAQAIVARKIEANRLTIRTDKPAVEVSWQVTGIRRDSFAETHRIPVEEDKPEAERGRCLYPEACGGRD